MSEYNRKIAMKLVGIWEWFWLLPLCVIIMVILLAFMLVTMGLVNQVLLLTTESDEWGF